MALTIQNKDINDPNKKQTTQPAGQPSSQPGTLQGQSVGAPTRQIGTQGPQPKGTGFTNIQKIIGANQGNQLGQAVVGGIKQAGQQARGNIEQAQGQFQQQVAQNTLSAEDQAKAQGLISQGLGGQDYTQEQLALAQKYREGAYGGPQELQNASQLATQAADVEQLGKLGSSEAGRTGLLQRFVGAPQYSAGQQRLDNLLLGSNTGAINQARSSIQGLANQSAKAIEAARAQGQVAAGQNESFANQFKGDIAGKTSGINTDVDTALKNAQSEEAMRKNTFNDFNNKLNNNLKGIPGLKNIIQTSGSFSPEQKNALQDVVTKATALGLNPETALRNSISQINAINIGHNEVMNQGQVASLNALAKLAGQNTSDYGQNVGTYKAGSQKTDTTKAQKALQNIQSKYPATRDVFERYLAGKANRNDEIALNKMLTAEDLAYIKANPTDNAVSVNQSQPALQKVRTDKSKAALEAIKNFESGNY